MAVRTPMQWSGDRNAGFSDVRPGKLVRPVVEGAYGPNFVNVAAQRHDPNSLLSFMCLLTRRYRECPEFGWGAFEVLDQEHAAVLAHRSVLDDGSLIALHNFGDEAVTVPIRLKDCAPDAVLVDLLREDSTTLDKGRAQLTLEAYGFRWLRVVDPRQRRLI